MMLIRQTISRILSQNAFLRNVGILTGGTVFAQGIMILALPVLTRLYSPEDFNLLAVYTSLIGLITVGACLRFNIAVPLPTSEKTAMDLLKLAMLAAAGVSVVLMLPVALAPGAAAQLLGQPEMQPYLWMVPLGGFLACVYDALQYWASRKKRFVLITQTRITRAVGGIGTQLGIGAIAPSPTGLIFGQLIYGSLGVLGLVLSMWRRDRAELLDTQMGRLLRTAREYRRYPRLSVPEAIFNTSGNELPVIIIAFVALGPEAGYLMLAIRVIGLPMGLIGGSVAQVYLAEAPEKLRDGTLVAFTRKTMWRLLYTGAPPLLAIGTFSPFLFPAVFGEDWARAGVIVAWLTPWFILQFIASPISMVLHVTGGVLLSMWLQLTGAVLRVGVLMIAVPVAPEVLTEVFAVSSALFYGIFILFILAELRKLVT